MRMKLKQIWDIIKTKSVKINLGDRTYRMRLLTLTLFALAVILLLIAIIILIIVGSCSPAEETDIPAQGAEIPGGEAGNDFNNYYFPEDDEPPEDIDLPGDDTEPFDLPEPEDTQEPTPEPTPEPTTAPDADPVFTETIKLNSSGPVVKVIQQRLVDLYYMAYPAKVDGVPTVTEKFGSTTQRALKMFQERNSIVVTGECDEATYNKLLSASAVAYVMQKNDKWKMVETIQDALKEQGYLAKVTGYCGDDTITAVKSFQKAKGLVADGIAGKGTLSVLLGY